MIIQAMWTPIGKTMIVCTEPSKPPRMPEPSRTASCKKRILDYVSGKIDSIPELSEQILPYGEAGVSMLAAGQRTFSTSCPD